MISLTSGASGHCLQAILTPQECEFAVMLLEQRADMNAQIAYGQAQASARMPDTSYPSVLPDDFRRAMEILDAIDDGCGCVPAGRGGVRGFAVVARHVAGEPPFDSSAADGAGKTSPL